jgi:hypothetical protein
MKDDDSRIVIFLLAAILFILLFGREAATGAMQGLSWAYANFAP